MTDKKDKSLKPGWRKVKFGDVVQLSKARCADPLAEGIERYVGLEHLEPGDLRIRSWGNVADGVTFTSCSSPAKCCSASAALTSARWRWPIFPASARATSMCWKARMRRLLLPELLPFICQTDAFFDHAVGTSAGQLEPAYQLVKPG